MKGRSETVKLQKGKSNMARVYMNAYEAYVLLAALKEYAAEASTCERITAEVMIDRLEGCLMLQGKKKTATIKIAADQITE